MAADGQGTKWRRNIAENFNWLIRAHERYMQTCRRQTDRWQTDGRQHNSEREPEFTFAKKAVLRLIKIYLIEFVVAVCDSDGQLAVVNCCKRSPSFSVINNRGRSHGRGWQQKRCVRQVQNCI